MLLLGTAYHGLLQRSDGAPAEHGRVLSAATSPPLPTEHWVLEDSSKDVRACSAGRRGAAEEECLAAVREAASRDGQEVAGFKSVNDGVAGVVPAGCSYSLHSKTAMFNANAAGGSGVGSYRLACLAPPDKAPISAAPDSSTVTGKHPSQSASSSPAATPTPPARGWVLDARISRTPGDFAGCPDGQRNAAEGECMAAVQEAAHGLPIRGLKVVDEGANGVVPGGCSYSRESKRALFNRNPAGRTSSSYELVCIEDGPVASDAATAVPKVDAPKAPLASPPSSVAVLLVGGVRGFDAERALNLKENVLDPVAEQTGRPVGVFACNEEGDTIPLDARRILETGNANLSMVDTAYTWQESNLPHAYLWAVRLQKCYQAARKVSNFSFYVRLRPDLVWGKPIKPVDSWSTDGVEVRMRMYAGHRLFTGEHQAWKRTDCGVYNLQPDDACAAPDADCLIVDDQLFIVPVSHADVVMNYVSGAGLPMREYRDWLWKPPMSGLDQGAHNGGERTFTYWLARNNVSVSVLAARAWLTKTGPRRKEFFWVGEFSCSCARICRNASLQSGV